MGLKDLAKKKMIGALQSEDESESESASESESPSATGVSGESESPSDDDSAIPPKKTTNPLKMFAKKFAAK